MYVLLLVEEDSPETMALVEVAASESALQVFAEDHYRRSPGYDRSLYLRWIIDPEGKLHGDISSNWEYLIFGDDSPALDDEREEPEAYPPEVAERLNREFFG